MNATSEFIWSSYSAAVNPNQQACFQKALQNKQNKCFRTSSAVQQDIIQRVEQTGTRRSFKLKPWKCLPSFGECSQGSYWETVAASSIHHLIYYKGPSKTLQWNEESSIFNCISSIRFIGRREWVISDTACVRIFKTRAHLTRLCTPITLKDHLFGATHWIHLSYIFLYNMNCINCLLWSILYVSDIFCLFI